MNQIKLLDNLFNKSRYTKPILCVEVSGNHQGQEAKLLEFIKQAALYGAEMIKFQVYTPETITLKSDKKDFLIGSDDTWSNFSTLYDLYEKAFTPWEWIKTGYKLCADLDIFPMASAFDQTSVDFLEDIGNQIYKIASPEITDINLIEYIAKLKKPIIFSTGLADQIDIDNAVDIVRKYHDKFMILKCVSAYPAPREEMNILSMKTLQSNYQCNVGLSDHTTSDEALLAATVLGAKLIEKHFKLDGDTTSIDNHFSVELSNIPNIQNKIHNIHECLGSSSIQISPSAKHSLSGRRSIYVSKNIRRGEVFTTDNLKSVRPCFGMDPSDLNKVLGKKSKHDLSIGDRMSLIHTEGD